jgi:hypothetical protein
VYEISYLVSYRVGDGFCIHFWQDIWCGEATLKPLFLELYFIASEKKALVLDYLYSSTYVHWNPSFFGAVKDWELESIVAFLDI